MSSIAISEILYVNSQISFKKDYGEYIYSYEYLTEQKLIKYKFIDKENINYLNAKYYYILEQLHNILNQEFKQNFSKEFYQKSLGMGFRRFIHMCYDAYLRHDKQFNDSYDFGLLSKEDFFIPNTFEDHRNFFQNTELSSEQLFAIYIDTFYKSNKNVFTVMSENSSTQIVQNKNSSSIFKRLKSLDIDKIYRRLLSLKYKNKKPKIGILGSFFSNKSLNKLIVKSNGYIKSVHIDYPNFNEKIDLKRRESCFSQIMVCDEFDKYLQNCFIYCFPKFFVEDFLNVIANYSNKIDSMHHIKYFLSESWLSCTKTSTFLALAKEQYSIKHIYNEHNYFEHPYLGNHNYLIAEMVDIFFNLGWKDRKNKDNIIKGASLFPFSIGKYSYQKNGKVLFISASPSAKIEEFNSAYGENGENGLPYLNFIKSFFYYLSNTVLNQIKYRGYPSKHNWLEYSKTDYVDLTRIGFIDDFSLSAKENMLSSKLVIIDYIATSVLEALIMNIPLVFFWNKQTYLLEDIYSDFFDDLVSCGICQTSPTEAANFVNDLVENDSIEKWWYSEQTQNSRKAFLYRNIGNPEDAINFYLSLVRE